MRTIAWGAARWISVVAVVFIATSCGDDSESRAETEPEDSIEAPSTAGEETLGVYVAYTGEGFRLQDGLNPSPDDDLATAGEPSLDWYAEYVSEPDSAVMVRVSGHDLSLHELQNERALSPFDLEEATAGEWSVLASGPAPEDLGGPALLVFEAAEDYSIQVLSYELDVDQLVAWAADLTRVSEDDWIAMGGVDEE